MEKEISTTGHGGTSSTMNHISYNSVLRSSSPPFLNYQSGGQDITIYQPELDMMIASRSPRSELFMDLHHRQDLMDRHNAVLSYLKETAKQAQTLRQENINLKMVNVDLTNRLALLLEATSDYAASFGFTGLDPNINLDAALQGLGMMSLAGDNGVGEGQGWEDVAAGEESPSPTSVMDPGRAEGSRNGVTGRVSLPKSISVRSNGYLKTVHAGGSSGGRVNKVLNRSKTINETQRVYVQGGEREVQPLELEVCNQGMFKTELCNKWQETGACPYGDHCQFAHGIEELRPVLRHPRYKTEVCRMMLNGDPCPYGHRCHFRHTLTDQEKLTRSMNLRALEALNW